jgi:hypothetical protein
MTVCFIVYVPGVVVNIMTESSHCFWKCDTNSGCRSLYNSLPKFGLVIIYLCKPTVGSWWSQWAVMAARQWYSWWRWWFDTLWVTLIRLWPHSWCVDLVFSGIDLTATFGLLLWTFPCSLRDNFYQLWCLNVLCSRHEVDMTVRLVVHYKGLNMGMVRRSLICPLNTLCLSHQIRYIWWNCVHLFWLTRSSLKMVAFTGL